jgi:predicted DNA-binding transcriptional regulator YafY
VAARQRRITVQYRRWRAPTDVTRQLEPHGIVLKAGKWYLVAADRGAMRTYRVSQILGLTVLAERFDRAGDFDLAAYWAAGIAAFRAGLHKGEAKIRLSPAGRERVAELYGAEITRAVDATASGMDRAGWVTATVPIESLQNAQTEFLRLGADVEILAPAELRTQMSAVVRSLTAIYSGAPPALTLFSAHHGIINGPLTDRSLA